MRFGTRVTSKRVREVGPVAVGGGPDAFPIRAVRPPLISRLASGATSVEADSFWGGAVFAGRAASPAIHIGGYLNRGQALSDKFPAAALTWQPSSCPRRGLRPGDAQRDPRDVRDAAGAVVPGATVGSQQRHERDDAGRDQQQRLLRGALPAASDLHDHVNARLQEVAIRFRADGQQPQNVDVALEVAGRPRPSPSPPTRSCWRRPTAAEPRRSNSGKSATSR